VTKTKKYPEPNILTRRDRPTLQWSAEECAPKRGVARTDLIGRRIFAPVGDTPLERIVRAHEMMHAKITPAEDLEKWLARKVATFEALQAVEEVRVNYGIQCAGFDLDELTDGNEDADGEYAAINGEWRKAVLFAVATAGTSGGKRFLVGVRRHNKTWATALQKIQKHVWKHIEGAHTGKIGRKRVRVEHVFSTEVNSNGLYPLGFSWTERWAEYVDRLGELPPQERKPKQKGTKKSKAKAQDESQGDEDGDAQGQQDGENEDESETISDRGGESDYESVLRRTKPLQAQRGPDKWSTLVWGKVPLTAVSKGRLGKRRVAMPYGRNPRRIGRLYTDPQRRVFDHERRAKGGIVLIDGSGSMSLTRANVLDILKVAPGATVAIYSDMDEGQGRPNIHVIAQDGKCVEEKNMPEFGAGNGVDLPALEWAIGQRKSKKTPIVWVTDGGVCVPNGGWDDTLALVCMRTAKTNNVVCVDHVDDAVKQLQALNNGQTVRVKYPQYFRQLVEKLGGMDRTQEVTAK